MIPQGLRLSVLLGSLGTCLGSWIKVFATGQAYFPLLFAGQTIVAISQIFILGIPPQLAATWFPSNQVSSACAIGVFGNQVNIENQNFAKVQKQATVATPRSTLDWKSWKKSKKHSESLTPTKCFHKESSYLVSSTHCF